MQLVRLFVETKINIKLWKNFGVYFFCLLATADKQVETGEMLNMFILEIRRS